MSIDAIPEIDPAEAKRLADAGDVILVDVREPAEWEAGHAPGAVHIPLGTLADGPPPGGNRIVAVCRSGARSGRATAALREWGYEAVNLRGGMQAWAESGLPVILDDGTDGAVI